MRSAPDDAYRVADLAWVWVRRREIGSFQPDERDLPEIRFPGILGPHSFVQLAGVITHGPHSLALLADGRGAYFAADTEFEVLV